jgi:hypothetical protein
MTLEGWRWFNKTIDDAKKLVPDPSLNPFVSYENTRWTDPLFLCALFVVVPFLVVYVYGLIEYWHPQ